MKTKRFLSLLLCLCMILTLLSAITITASAEEMGTPAIILGTDGIMGGGKNWVYYGKFDATSNGINDPVPIKWRVLAAAGGNDGTYQDSNGDHVSSSNAMFLLTEKLLKSKLAFGSSNVWASSYLKGWMEDNIYNSSGVFSEGEKEQILLTTTTMDADVGGASSEPNLIACQLNGATLFALSADEATRSKYGFTAWNTYGSACGRLTSNLEPPYDAGAWWLRSPSVLLQYAGFVNGGGYVYDNGYSSSWGVRPAFNLNRNAVLFSSCATDGKSVVGMDSTLTPVSHNTPTEWKLTILDSKRNFVVKENSAAVKVGGKVTLNYSGAAVYDNVSAPNEYISAMITDAGNNILYYGRLVQPASSDGELEVTIPAALGTGSYTLKMFSEQYNGSKQTDYASAFQNIALTVDNTAPSVLSVTPSDSGVSIDGSITVTFNECMKTSAGTVSLDGGASVLTGGAWSLNNTVYTAPYSGLSYHTAYTVTVSGFQDTAGNVMGSGSTPNIFTTADEPLLPSVTLDKLTLNKKGSAVFTLAFGQGTSAATGAAISVVDSNIAAVSSSYAVSPGAITVTGLAAGVTDIMVTFNDTTSTVRRITVTVQPVAPTWPSGSTFSASEVTRTGAVLTWTAAQDVTAVTGYKLYRDGTEIATISGSAYRFPVTGLSAGTSYSFRIQAGNADGIWTTNGPDILVTTATPYSGDSSSANTDGTTVTIQPEKKPDQPIINEIIVTSVLDKYGHASVAVSEKSVIDAIEKAQAKAKAQGKTANGIGITVKVELSDTVKSVGITFTQHMLRSLIDAEVKLLSINGTLVSMSFDQEALKEIQKQSTGDVTISLTPSTVLSKKAKALIRNRPVYNITISYIKDGKTLNITSLGMGSVTLSIPFTPGKREAAGYLYGVYVADNGKASRVSGSAYDTNSKSIIFDSSHFSIYGVGYTTPAAQLTDITNHWAKEAIDYVIGRGLLAKTTDTTFSPDTAITRGMLVTALGRLAGVDAKSYKTSSFIDVAMDQYYASYAEWAYKKGIISGNGTYQFNPDSALTREEIALIFSNYAKATGYILPVTREAIVTADADSISSSFRDAVKAMQQSGIMMSGAGDIFNPKASITRAEVSAMLHRYVKLTIDPATAQGWALNDAGQYLYYMEGKPLTGWQTLEGTQYYFEASGIRKVGWLKLDINNISKHYYFTSDGDMVSGKWLKLNGKWYYFYANGSLAVNTTIDGCKVNEYGVKETK